MSTDTHFHSIPQDGAPEILNLIVEIAEGDSNKYEYNTEYGIIELDRVLYGPNYYPVNYCDVPSTWNEGDDDPLDVALFSTHPIVPGALVKGRVIGIMEMIDNDEQDHKVICVADNDPRYDHINHVDELAPYQRKDLKTFMETYKIPQTGPGSVKAGGFHGPKKAHEVITESIKAYKEKFGE